jgi:hypothetical protein
MLRLRDAHLFRRSLKLSRCCRADNLATAV